MSFGDEEDPEIDQAEAGSTATAGPSGTGGLDGEAPTKKKRITKDPTANTVGLPDRERDELDRLERERLRKEWLAEQERIKGEVIEIVYSYWDGSGHRKSVEVCQLERACLGRSRIAKADNDRSRRAMISPHFWVNAERKFLN